MSATVDNQPIAVADSATTSEDVAVVVNAADLLNNDNLGDTPTTITTVETTSANGGTIVDNTDDTYSYTPAAGFTGQDTFNYTITDIDGDASTATVTIDVNPANEQPVAVVDSVRTSEDVALTLNVTDLLSNDDLGDTPTTITTIETASVNGGTIADNADGTYTYTPAAGFIGTDTFSYTITDTDGDTSTATVTIDITAANSQPLAAADSATTDVDTAIVITETNLLSNDELGDTPTTITTVETTSANGGTIVDNGDTTYTYTPAAGFIGTDTFSYTITDTDGDTSSAVVAVEVNTVNNLPTATADGALTGKDTAITLSSTTLLSNDDLGDTPTIITTVETTSANGGTIVDNTDGTYTYTPAAGFVGIDGFSYAITDADGDTSSATVAVEVIDYLLDLTGYTLDLVDGKPRRALENGFVFDATDTGGPAAHFHQPGMPSFLTQHNVGGNGPQINFTLTRGDGSAFSFESFDYTSGLHFNGDLNGGFTVIGTLADGTEVSQSFGPALVPDVFQNATLFGMGWQNVVSVRFVGDRIATTTDITQELNLDNFVIRGLQPVATADTASTNQDTALLISKTALLDNDSPGNGPLTFTGVDLTTASNGLVADNGDGTLTYTPAAGFIGTDTFNYFIADTNGDASRTTVSVEVAESISLPVSGLVVRLDAGSGVTTNSNNVVTEWNDQSGFGNDVVGLGDPTLLTDALNGRSVISFDGNGDKLTRALGLNGLPTANADRSLFVVTRYDGFGYGGVTYGDNRNNRAFGAIVDGDGTLGVQGWGNSNDFDSGITGTGSGWLIQEVLHNNGTLNHYKDGVLIDSQVHTYRTDVANGEGLVIGAELDGTPYVDMDIAEVLIYDRALSEAERQQVETYLQTKYFGPVDSQPVAEADASVSEVNSAVNIDVLEDDSFGMDGPGSEAIALTTAANNGTAIVNDGGTPNNPTDDTIDYIPDTDFVGQDSFTYTIMDADGDTSTATVTVDVSDNSGLPVSGLVVHLSGDTGVNTDANGVVVDWVDQSGLGNDLTSFGDPTLEVGALNGHNVIKLDGAQDKLARVLSLNGLPEGNAERSLFLVAKYNGNGNGGATYGDNRKNQAFGAITDRDGTLMVQGWGDTNDFDSEIVGTGEGWLLQEVVYDGSTLDHYKDGSLIDTRTHTYATDVAKGNGLVIGAEIDSDPFVDMEVAALLIYDRALSETERQQVETYLQGKYFGSSNRPSAAVDTFETNKDAALMLTDADLLGNDNLGDTPTTITTVETTSASDGTIVDNADGTYTYTPAAGFIGTDSFSYSITDVDGDTSTAMVTVEVVDYLLDLTDYTLDLVDGKPRRVLENEFVFDATDTGGPAAHFHQPGMPSFLTQHNVGGNGPQINFTLARGDGSAFSFESFDYTSGLHFNGNLNGGFTVIGTLADGTEVSQSFAPALVPDVFQTAALVEAGWQNVISVRFVGDRIATTTDITQELNLDNLILKLQS